MTVPARLATPGSLLGWVTLEWNLLSEPQPRTIRTAAATQRSGLGIEPERSERRRSGKPRRMLVSPGGFQVGMSSRENKRLLFTQIPFQKGAFQVDILGAS